MLNGDFSGSINQRSQSERPSEVTETAQSCHVFHWVTPHRVANITTSVCVSVGLGVSAVLADMLGYLIYCAFKKEVPVLKKATEFAFIPEVGSFIFMFCACLAFSYSGLIGKLYDVDNRWVRGLAWFIVETNFLVNTGLGFLVDHLAMNDQHFKLIHECLWSKLFSFAVVLLGSAAVVVCGGEKYIGEKLFNLYQSIYKPFDAAIGISSEAYETGKISDCWAAFRNNSANQYTRLAEDTNGLNERFSA